MAAEIVAHAGADAFRHAVEIAENLGDRHRRNLRIFLGEIVQIVDVGLMVQVVMNCHGPGIDMRLERVDGVGEGIELEGTGGRGSRGLRKGDAGRGCNSGNTSCRDHQMAPGHGSHRGVSVEGKLRGKSMRSVPDLSQMTTTTSAATLDVMTRSLRREHPANALNKYAWPAMPFRLPASRSRGGIAGVPH